MIRRLTRLLNRRPRPLPSLLAYQKWAAAYPPHAHNALMRAEESAMLALLPPLDGTSVLDLACGTGRYSLLCEQRGAKRVIGLDSSLAMLARSTGMLRAVASMEHLPVASAAFDVIVCGLAIGHLRAVQAAFAEMARVLKRGGVCVTSDVHPQVFQSGAQRTFEVNGVVFAVEHTVHPIRHVIETAAAVGLTLDAFAEPPLLPVDLPTDGTPAPVAVIYRFVKPFD